MAISKILCIGSCGAGYAGKHLRQALDYIAEPEKTGGGRFVGALNCQPERAYEQMRETKEQFGKMGKRQGYHLILSFAEGEVDAETAFEIVGRFAEEVLGRDYEALYSVHDNTDHIHGHIVFNSVSFRTGNKYRYKKGDWAGKLQPALDRLCEEYGLSVLARPKDRQPIPGGDEGRKAHGDRPGAWSEMIRRDIDACIRLEEDYEGFLFRLAELGYEIKNQDGKGGKYLAVRPMGHTRFRRCKTLGEDYGEERIRERIQKETLSEGRRPETRMEPKIVRCRFRRYKRAKLSEVQRRYLAKLYRLGRLKKRPYSQMWKYRNEIRNLKKLQEEYLFLVQKGIRTEADAVRTAALSGEKRKKTKKERSRITRERARMKPLFDTVSEMKELSEMEQCYQKGELLFEKEHVRYGELASLLEREGYDASLLEQFRQHYKREMERVRKQEREAAGEERMAKRILEEITGQEKDQTRKGGDPCREENGRTAWTSRRI